MAEKTAPKTIEITAKDLPLQCPPASAEGWNKHPRVFLDISHGDAVCPYCSMRYVFKGDLPKGH